MENGSTLSQAEQWKPVVGYEGLYEASDQGRIRSILTRWGNPRCWVMKSHKSNHGYLMLTLAKDGIHKGVLIHRLVIAAFRGACPLGYCVNHKDGHKDNNNLENLEYVTRSENNWHASRLGLLAMGTRHGNAKLNPDAVREIRKLAITMSSCRIAPRFGVAPPTIDGVLKGKTWRHVV